jgi:hypothetical protein
LEFQRDKGTFGALNLALEIKENRRTKIMMLARKKEGPVRGCLVPLLAVIGVLAVCYVFCFALYLLNSTYVSTVSNEGGMLLPIFH